MKIQTQGQEAEKLVYNSTNQVSEKEVEEFVETFNSLSEMSRFESEFLRKRLEKASPMLGSLLQKFIVLEMAKQESLMVVSQSMTCILKEFMAVKYGAKNAEA